MPRLETCAATRGTMGAVPVGFCVGGLFHYARLSFIVRWPQGLTTSDVLFLIRVPWFAQVWFAYHVSALTIAAILCNITRPDARAEHSDAAA